MTDVPVSADELTDELGPVRSSPDVEAEIREFIRNDQKRLGEVFRELSPRYDPPSMMTLMLASGCRTPKGCPLGQPSNALFQLSPLGLDHGVASQIRTMPAGLRVSQPTREIARTHCPSLVTESNFSTVVPLRCTNIM